MSDCNQVTKYKAILEGSLRLAGYVHTTEAIKTSLTGLVGFLRPLARERREEWYR